MYKRWKSCNESFISSLEADETDSSGGANLVTDECILILKKEQIENEVYAATSIEQKLSILLEYINLSNTHLTLRYISTYL